MKEKRIELKAKAKENCSKNRKYLAPLSLVSTYAPAAALLIPRFGLFAASFLFILLSIISIKCSMKMASGGSLQKSDMCDISGAKGYVVLFLWRILYAFLYFIPEILFFFSYFLAINLAVFSAVTVLFAFAFSIGIYLLSSLAPTSYIAFEKPDAKASSVLYTGRVYMKGLKGEYLWLVFSFTGWWLLVIATAGILSFYVAPYFNETLALWYKGIGISEIREKEKGRKSIWERIRERKDDFIRNGKKTELTSRSVPKEETAS